MANKPLVARLIARHPRHALSTSILLDELKVNHTFHESCHAVAHSSLSASPAALLPLSDSAAGRFVWQAVIEDAFANTLERLAGHFLHSSAHRVFDRLNTYIGNDAVPAGIIDNALDSHAPSAVFRTLFLSFRAAT